jgi:hypothetical protein
MKKSETNTVGLFPVSYITNGPVIGGAHLSLQLLVNTPARAVNGRAEVRQTTSPPLNVVSAVHGDFTYMTVMPKNTHILVVLTGYPVVQMPPAGGTGPVILPNVHVRMVLSDDWKSGTANFRYQDNNGNWQELDNQTVQMVKAEEAVPA